MTVRKRNTESKASTTIPNATYALVEKHEFERHTFTRPSYCDRCSQFIWGLDSQGDQCTGCGYKAHKKCSPLVSTPCHPVKQQHADIRLINDKDEAFEEGSECETISSSTVSSPSSLKTLQNKEVAAPREDLQRGSVIADLFANAQSESKKLEQTVKDISPPLTLSLMLKNNSRYVQRQAPFIKATDTIVAIVNWTNPLHTVCFLLGYVVVCSYPMLFAVLPQLAMLYVMFNSYQQRVTSPAEPSVAIGMPPKITLTNAEYKANLQNIQNTMGHISDLYDAGFALYQRLNWTDPELTMSMLYGTVLSVFGSLLLFWWVPLNKVLLIIGVALLIGNTAVFKAIHATLSPIVVQSIQSNVGIILDKVVDARSQKSRETIINVSVFENQRWWVGVGFAPLLLHGERHAWSDETGAIPQPPKEMTQLPAQTETINMSDGHKVINHQTWQWVDAEWQLDRTWNAEVDAPQGWVYSDNFWLNARRTPGAMSYTRRRKWTRAMKMSQ